MLRSKTSEWISITWIICHTLSAKAILCPLYPFPSVSTFTFIDIKMFSPFYHFLPKNTVLNLNYDVITFKLEIIPTWQARWWWTLPMSSGLQTPTNSHPLGPARCARSIMNIFVNGPLWMFLRTRSIMVVFTQIMLTTIFSCEAENGEIEIDTTASCQSMSSIKP